MFTLVDKFFLMSCLSRLPDSIRLEFRCWSLSDLEIATALWGDTDVTKYIGTIDPTERLSREISTMETAGVQYWPIFLKTTGEHVGCCGLRPHQKLDSTTPGERSPEFELGFHLRKEHWGHGYAKEAALAVIRYAFEEKKATGIFAGHNPNNVASKHVISQLGFKLIGEQLYPPTGLFHPCYVLWREA